MSTLYTCLVRSYLGIDNTVIWRRRRLW